MSPFAYALLSALANVAGAMAVAGRARRSIKLLDALIAVAAGFMISVALTQLVPEALARGGSSAPMVILVGYLAVHLTQHTLTEHFHFGEETIAACAVAVFLGHLYPVYFGFVSTFRTDEPVHRFNAADGRTGSGGG